MRDEEFESFLKTEFLGEAEDLMADSNEIITSESPDLNRLFRNIHTMKASSQTAGFNGIGQFAHYFENALAGINDTGISLLPDLMQLITDCIYHLSDLTSQAKSTGIDNIQNPELMKRLYKVVLQFNNGSMVKIPPPAIEPEPEPEPAAPVPEAKEPPSNRLHFDKTILLVDDEFMNLRILKAFLKGFGFKVLCEQRAVAGLGMLAWQRPDLVLVDINMKELNGIDFIKAASQIDPTTPIIAVSGVENISMPSSIKNKVQQLTKPFELDDLMESVTQGLKSSTKTILVVDDEQAIRSVLEFQLTDAGFEVITASDGEEAFKKTKGIPIDCVITDLKMSGMNGYKFLTSMKNSPFEKVPKIVLTGQLDAGRPPYADICMFKPWTQENLIGTVKNLMAQ